MENQYANFLLSKLSNVSIPTVKELEDNAINSFVRRVIDNVVFLVKSESKLGKFATLLDVGVPPNLIKFEPNIKSNIINELFSLGFKANFSLLFKSNNEWTVYVSWNNMDSSPNSPISKFIEASMESLLNLTVERIKKTSSLGVGSTEMYTGGISPILMGVIVKMLTDKGYTVIPNNAMSKIDISW
jgi:hypothetical protein